MTATRPGAWYDRMQQRLDRFARPLLMHRKAAGCHHLVGTLKQMPCCAHGNLPESGPPGQADEQHGSTHMWEIVALAKTLIKTLRANPDQSMRKRTGAGSGERQLGKACEFPAL